MKTMFTCADISSSERGFYLEANQQLAGRWPISPIFRAPLMKEEGLGKPRKSLARLLKVQKTSENLRK